MRILVTGATGNVGRAVLLRLRTAGVDVVAGVRDVATATARLGETYEFCVVDFERQIYPAQAFDAIFLVRPPQLAAPAIFASFLASLRPDTRVVFLSVQGADTKTYLPHAKIEKVIAAIGLPHVFVRPSYFMENLTTTLWPELAANRRIFLPAGDLRLNWIAVADVAEVAALALTGQVSDAAVGVSNTTTLDFHCVVNAINRECGTNLTYGAPGLFAYVAYSLRQGHPLSYLFVMLLLHYLPRFSREKTVMAGEFKRITGRDPQPIETFIADNAALFSQLRVPSAHREA